MSAAPASMPPPCDARFEVGPRRGSGAFGRVYEAVDRRRGMRVAVKTLPPLSPAEGRRVRAEFDRLRAFSHPHVAALYDLFDDANPPFYSMRLVDGVGLLQYVRGPAAGGSVAPPVVMGQRVNALGRDTFAGCTPAQTARLRRALAPLVDALAAFHRAGFVHRDLNPDNVLVEPDGAVFLTDYGPSPAGSIAGTAAYMAPEQRADAGASPAGDWYSVGVVLFEALTGALPFDGDAQEVMLRKATVRAPSPSLLVRGVAGDLNALCASLLERDPRDRPGGDELRRIVRGPHDSVPVG